MKKIQNNATIVSNKKITDQFYHMKLDVPAIVKKVQPGQFIHLKVTDGLDPFFRRPFSVMRADRYVEILYDVVGTGTEILATLKKGHVLDILGPLGTPFQEPPAGVTNIVIVAGGVGVAPFLCLTDSLKKKQYAVTLLYGARSKVYTWDMREFKKNGCTVLVSTDDGSRGTKGRVSVLFKKIKADAQKTFVYTCGPRPMMASVQEWARKNSLRGEASCEEVMACGLGACLGCSIKTTVGYRTVCNDGPVFDLHQLIF